MKINQIVLYNFGSYEGQNTFDFTSEDPNKRMVIIGGKNGAGKTTLFTAIETCFYGNYAFGFKTAGKVYLKEIFKLINNNARLDERSNSYVEITFEQNDNAELNTYVVRRAWSWKGSNVEEEFCVLQNGQALEEDDLLNYQNYLLHLIPPDMLKLYFFDGEKIADYFLKDQEINFRDAVMVLSGYDTFQILYENIKRLSKPAEQGNYDQSMLYLEARHKFNSKQKAYQTLNDEISELHLAADEITAEINRAQKSYQARGGISLAEWKSLNDQMKDEEAIRERLNYQRKQDATELLPFMMLRPMIDQIRPQIEAEKSYYANKALSTDLQHERFTMLLTDYLSRMNVSDVNQRGAELKELIKGYLLQENWDQLTPLFGLSGDDEAQVISLISKVQSTDPDLFRNYQKDLDESIERTRQLRAKLQNSDVEHFEEFVSQMNELEKQQNEIHVQLELKQRDLETQQVELGDLESKMKSARAKLEDSLKKKSVTSTSGRVLLVLDELLDYISVDLVAKVEQDVNLKLRQLLRKKDFFTEVKIDPDFSVHILREKTVSKQDLAAMTRGGTLDAITAQLGAYAVVELQKQLGTTDATKLNTILTYSMTEEYILPVVIDKQTLSSGEKQIFVMSLYWALMNQSKSNLPYIIDTPFARIDTEHRKNIVSHFFNALNGQLIVLSTDEEISDRHLQSMSDQISSVYMLDYGEDKKTHIHQNTYFEAGEQ